MQTGNSRLIFSFLESGHNFIKNGLCFSGNVLLWALPKATTIRGDVGDWKNQWEIERTESNPLVCEILSLFDNPNPMIHGFQVQRI